MVPRDTNARRDFFVHDRLTGTTERVSVTTTGGQSTNAFRHRQGAFRPPAAPWLSRAPRQIWSPATRTAPLTSSCAASTSPIPSGSTRTSRRRRARRRRAAGLRHQLEHAHDALPGRRRVGGGRQGGLPPPRVGGRHGQLPGRILEQARRRPGRSRRPSLDRWSDGDQPRARGDRHLLSPTRLAALVSEDAAGTKYSRVGYGPYTVAHLHPAGAGAWTDLGAAADVIEMAGTFAVFITPEGAEGVSLQW